MRRMLTGLPPSVRVPAAPAPFLTRRSMPIFCPPSLTVPARRTLGADANAFCAAARISPAEASARASALADGPADAPAAGDGGAELPGRFCAASAAAAAVE